MDNHKTTVESGYQSVQNYSILPRELYPQRQNISQMLSTTDNPYLSSLSKVQGVYWEYLLKKNANFLGDTLYMEMYIQLCQVDEKG